MISVRGYITTAEVSDLKSGNYSTLKMKDERKVEKKTSHKEPLMQKSSYSMQPPMDT